VFPPEGYCVRDNGGGTVCAVDADCGLGGVCADIAEFSPYRMCLAACCMFDACPTHQACWSTFNGVHLDRPACVPGNAAGADGQACAGFYECNELSRCAADFEHPNGDCQTYGCTVGSTAGCHGGDLCIVNDEEPPFTSTICVVGCDTGADCRESEGYVCYDPDLAAAGDEYCRHPHVGDPCAVAADCGGAPWECLVGAAFPNGYCSQTGCPTPGNDDGCTSGSICSDLGLFDACVDRCPTVGTTAGCRAGYTCVDVDPGPSAVGGCVGL
jgi:hypothetical protein